MMAGRLECEARPACRLTARRPNRGAVLNSCHFTKATMAKSAATKKKAAAGGAKKKKAPAGGKKGKTNGAGGAGSAKKKREPKKVGRARTHGPLPKNFGTYLPRQPRGLRLGF